MSLGEAFANWRCVCGRPASVEHPIGGYCSGKEIIEKLSAERDKLKAELNQRMVTCIKANEEKDVLTEERDLLKARVERLESLLSDIQYCFQNIWALDRKAFEERFMPRIAEALKADEASQ